MMGANRALICPGLWELTPRRRLERTQSPCKKSFVHSREANYEIETDMNWTTALQSGKIGGRDRVRTGDPLLAKPATRLQQLRPFSLTTNVSNKSGTLLFAQS
jgi:hypothetical protein